MSTMPPSARRPLLTYAQLSQLLTIPVDTLYYMVHEDRIPYLRLGPRTVRFDPDEIDAWVRRDPGGPR